ncbi:hypothetical protein PGTUg99_010921 [Puccinia graminis f. sp. tritici]|uniref:Uncharacterized protein n=1 Tax=Puccinia graminis f. sp. tritici TaxID=56615 RepID=A0A5B0NUZ8_PUCGR|nr:hypothetical protein PGTUg99_010921 [Puccinia graminis f. sp. tritici]
MPTSGGDMNQPHQPKATSTNPDLSQPELPELTSNNPADLKQPEVTLANLD